MYKRQCLLCIVTIIAVEHLLESPLSPMEMCIRDRYNTLKYEWPEVTVDEAVAEEAVKPIKKMLEISEKMCIRDRTDSYCLNFTLII